MVTDTLIVNPILLHRNDTDCQMSIYVNLRLWSENVIFSLAFLNHGGGTQYIHFSGDQPHRPKSRTMCNFGPGLLEFIVVRKSVRMITIFIIHLLHIFISFTILCSFIKFISV